MSATSWGRLGGVKARRELPLRDRQSGLPALADAPMLAHGLGRSYGDVALNDGGDLLLTRGLDRFIAFDVPTGVLRAEAGLSLKEVIDVVWPRGWFLAVTPGTQHVTLGGAVANDVHGKNHLRAGSFGHHVRAVELLRSDGQRMVCSRAQNDSWLRATIGGLGLTGLITWVEIQLTRMPHPWVSTIQRRFSSIHDYWALDAELGPAHEFAVAWVDCLNDGRGIYTAGNLAACAADLPQPRRRERVMRFCPPFSLVNELSLRLFNFAYFHRKLAETSLVHYRPFFYPLDGLLHWNRMYGRRGFYQYQCVLPPPAMRKSADAMFRIIARARQGSLLAVFKTFGNQPAPGLLSFARSGATLALDFPNRGAATLKLFDEMDTVVRDAGGALYPAKDARMSPRMFREGYPALDQFAAFVDPAFSSSFWRRVQP